jgi:hypothetical protein
VGAALIVLCAAMPVPRGGGDLDKTDNWHGPERDYDVNPEHGSNAAPMPDEYSAIAARTIGRWAGDHIALIGDYAEADDIPGIRADMLYGCCCSEADFKAWLSDNKIDPDIKKAARSLGRFTDISADVQRVLEHELHGKFVPYSKEEDSGCEWLDKDAFAQRINAAAKTHEVAS